MVDPRDAQLSALRSENEQLRAELARRDARTAQAQAARGEALKTGGQLLLPMFDRQRVVRSGLELFDAASGFTAGREAWPERELLLDKGRAFALSLLRFMVRRRLLMLAISLLAFLVPVVQVWLVFQQNAIIENQDKYFNIQVYDIVAQSITGRDTTAKQITSALLAREDFELVNGIISAVFESEMGGAFTEEDVAAGQPVFLEETAARGHLLSALVLGIERHQKTKSPDELWEEVRPTFELVAKDTATRLPQLLRIDRKAAFKEPLVGRECFRYLFSLSSLMRRVDSLARAEDAEGAFFEALAPAMARLSRAPRLDGAFDDVFVSAMQELLVDLALEPDFGEGSPDIASKDLDPLIAKGFERLVAGVRPHAPNLDPERLRRRLGVTP